jgi:hypothetical protein
MCLRLYYYAVACYSEWSHVSQLSGTFPPLTTVSTDNFSIGPLRCQGRSWYQTAMPTDAPLTAVTNKYVYIRADPRSMCRTCAMYGYYHSADVYWLY